MCALNCTIYRSAFSFSMSCNGATAGVAPPAARPAGNRRLPRNAPRCRAQKVSSKEQQVIADTLAPQSGVSPSVGGNAAERQQQAAAPPPQLATPGPSRPLLVGAAATLAAVGGAAYSFLSQQPQLPPLDQVLGPLAVAGLGGPLAALLAAKLLLGDMFHVELHRGRLYLTLGVPSAGPRLAPGAVVVRPAADPRLGNGAFAAARIPKGTYLGDYTGELLDRAAFFARYPAGVGDYAAAIDDEWTIDAVGAVANTAQFHPVHMNHSRGRANVRRFYRRAQRRISFFTSRDVEAGEELLYDYGRAYWRGREQLELP